MSTESLFRPLLALARYHPAVLRLLLALGGIVAVFALAFFLSEDEANEEARGRARQLEWGLPVDWDDLVVMELEEAGN